MLRPPKLWCTLSKRVWSKRWWPYGGSSQQDALLTSMLQGHLTNTWHDRTQVFMVQCRPAVQARRAAASSKAAAGAHLERHAAQHEIAQLAIHDALLRLGQPRPAAAGMRSWRSRHWQ